MVASITNQLLDMSENLLACRDMRHAWAVESDFHVHRASRGRIQEVRRILACMRCAAVERIETYGPARHGGLEKLRQHYKYDPEKHYIIKGVPQGTKPTEIARSIMFERVMARLAEHGLPVSDDEDAGVS